MDKKERKKYLNYKRQAIDSIERHQYWMYVDALEYALNPSDELKANVLSRATSMIDSVNRIKRINEKLGILC